MKQRNRDTDIWKGEMLMIARVATFTPMAPDVEAEMHRNLRVRFISAIQEQEGFIAAYWLMGEDKQVWSISFWESEEAMRAGGQRANATPLVPGQDASKIASPDTVQVLTVFGHATGNTSVQLTEGSRWFADKL
jgi:Antibiotic biosynthesis monooxygenase